MSAPICVSCDLQTWDSLATGDGYVCFRCLPTFLPVVNRLAAMLRYNDDCGPGPVSVPEYRADATELLRAVFSEYAPALNQTDASEGDA